MSGFTITAQERLDFIALRATTGAVAFDALVETELKDDVGIDPYSGYSDADKFFLLLAAGHGDDPDTLTPDTLTKTDIALYLDTFIFYKSPFEEGNYIFDSEEYSPSYQKFVNEASNADERRGFSLVDQVWLSSKHGNLFHLDDNPSYLSETDARLYYLAELNDVFGLSPQEERDFNNRLSKLGLGDSTTLTPEEITQLEEIAKLDGEEGLSDKDVDLYHLANTDNEFGISQNEKDNFNNRLSKLGLGDSTTLTPEKIGELEKIAGLDGEAGLSDHDVELYHLANLDFVIAHAGHWVDWFMRALNQS